MEEKENASQGDLDKSLDGQISDGRLDPKHLCIYLKKKIPNPP